MRVLWSLALSLAALPLAGGCVVKEREVVREEPVVEKRIEVRERPAEVNPKVEVNVDK